MLSSPTIIEDELGEVYLFIYFENDDASSSTRGCISYGNLTTS